MGVVVSFVVIIVRMAISIDIGVGLAIIIAFILAHQIIYSYSISSPFNWPKPQSQDYY